MQIVANGIGGGIETDHRGSPAGEPLLLIMGFGMQLIGWPEELVDLLVARGFRVLRMNNRETSLSQHLDHLGVPNMALSALRHMLRAAGRFVLRHQRHGKRCARCVRRPLNR